MVRLLDTNGKTLRVVPTGTGTAGRQAAMAQAAELARDAAAVACTVQAVQYDYSGAGSDRVLGCWAHVSRFTA